MRLVLITINLLMDVSVLFLIFPIDSHFQLKSLYKVLCLPGYSEEVICIFFNVEKYEVAGQCAGLIITAVCDAPFGWSELRHTTISSPRQIIFPTGNPIVNKFHTKHNHSPSISCLFFVSNAL